ncbi:rust resistance kinase Lr10-like [Syzygium oleosum]|uniref:rust resistance kinase Lr10-like n=1 Tax=Syzygium oleosum TaxID=219896 RepID=UPI0024B8EF66|nr:rust resistance kinase Lr10-like [Syzygium oleosum]
MINSHGSLFMYHIFLLILLVLLLGTSCGAKKNHLCTASSCGEVRNISYPFRLKGNPKSCGHSKYELACENNRTVLYLHAGRYYVKSIHYRYHDYKGNFRGDITVVDDSLQKGNCSSLPRYSLADSNFSGNDVYSPYFKNLLVFVKCSLPVASTSYVDTKQCIGVAYSAGTPSNFSQTKVYSYALHGHGPDALGALDIQDSCTITMMAFASVNILWWEKDRVSLSYKELHNMMTEGFNLTYIEFNSQIGTARFCFLGFTYRLQRCSYYNSNSSMKAALALYALPYLPFFLAQFIAAKFILGAPCVLIFLIYKWMRRHRAMDENIEEFLQAHNNFFPIRYSYSDIKKITKNFKHKIGEGGYGSVYKGILRSGNEVAVKILNKPKSNGQDFMSEVATIGRIHHVNVVQLVGFCFKNSKQALVCDFMPNGSLDKHIFSKDGDDSLDYKKIYEISLGVARGIEYLHRGCDIQILHFDIKPHNILLDQNFTPKVSDFGLARLYPVDHKIVSLTAARGTLGYMAPELFYKDIGGVSYKADVYSFGMLLMEMAGRRKNAKANVERSSQVYFPLWVYDQLSKENEVEMEEVEGEREITRKMVIVALWCIQLIPNDRPSMSRVLNMLEGDIDQLRLPPKPLLYPSEKPLDDMDTEIELESFSITSSAPTISEGYRFQNSNEITESCIV